MTTYTSDQYAEQMPTSTEAGEQLVFQCRYKFTSAVTLAQNDIIKMAQLPPNFVVTDIRMETDALGTSSAVSVGLLNAGATDMSQTLIGAASSASAVIRSTDVTAGVRVGPSTSVTPIGVKVTTAGSADLSANAICSLTIRYRPKQNVEIV